MIKWVARLAIITALLGLVGTVIIIKNISHNRNCQKPAVTNKELTIPEILEKAEEQPSPTTANETVAAKRETTPKKERPVTHPRAGNVEEKAETKQPVESTSGKKTVPEVQKDKTPAKQNQSEKEPEEKLFSPEELQQLVDRIKTLREENSITSNCVQIFSTKQGNYARTVAQVETYLKSQRFAIAGREVISRKVKGILVTANSGCVRITIGTF